jgi:hypothetical protein
VIYDAIERAATVAAANFDTDLAALAVAKTETLLASSTTVYKRRTAEAFEKDVTEKTAGLGIYWESVQTEVKDQGKRDSTVFVLYDYYAIGSDLGQLEKQVELAAEALMQSIDRLADSSVLAAGEAPGSVIVLAFLVGQGEEGQHYEGRVILRFPVLDRDQGL